MPPWWPEFAPAGLGIVEIVGQVAILDEPVAAVFDLQPDIPTLDVEVLQRHMGDADGRNAHALVVLRIALTPITQAPAPSTITFEALITIGP